MNPTHDPRPNGHVSDEFYDLSSDLRETDDRYADTTDVQSGLGSRARHRTEHQNMRNGSRTMGKKWYLSIVSAAVATLAAVWSHAGPLLPEQPSPPEEALSLSKVTQFQLDPILLSPLLKDAAVNARPLARKLRGQLRRQGIELADNPALPRLVLTILTDTDPDQPESVALTIIMAVHQRVRIDRINRSLSVPTATTGNTRLTTKRSLSSAVERGMQNAVGTLLDYIQWASRPP
jgi:hypothetical protein